jgi:hypothetical protein
MRHFKVLLALALAAAFPVAALWATDPRSRQSARIAALALPFGQRADWQQWDSFLTHVVKRLGQEFGADQRDQVEEVFLDARYELVQALSSGSSDPVPRLFVDTWTRLSPLLKQSIPGLSQESASQFSSFATAMDGVASLTGMGQQLGFVRITPEALRGAATLLGKTDVDPLAYSLDVDNALRAILGFTTGLPTPHPSPLLEQGSSLTPATKKASVPWHLFWNPRGAHAAEANFSKLNEWLPDDREVQDYLEQVRDLLGETYGKVLQKSNLVQEFHGLYRQIVFATAWQESCWRQFVRKGQKLAPLSSATGDVGLMQVNRRVWRGLYNLQGLSGDIEYNGYAGAEILMKYLTRYAIRKNEDKQPGGNLARATYSAYNAGPSGLARYRGVRQGPTWKKVDDAFWVKFQAVSSGQELAVKSCYGQQR